MRRGRVNTRGARPSKCVKRLRVVAPMVNRRGCTHAYFRCTLHSIGVAYLPAEDCCTATLALHRGYAFTRDCGPRIVIYEDSRVNYDDDLLESVNGLLYDSVPRPLPVSETAEHFPLTRWKFPMLRRRGTRDWRREYQLATIPTPKRGEKNHRDAEIVV